jgi:hypothetical protein
MKTGTPFVATLFALASFPLLAQQPPPASQMPPSSQATSPEAPAIELSPVKGELVSKLDSKTAKAGDSVVVQTKSAVKTADGTEIPKGSKVVGHVMGVHPSEEGKNAQVALQFDHVELKGGQNMPIHSQIQSIAPAGGATSATSGPPTSSPSTPNTNGTPGSNNRTNGMPQSAGGATAAPAAGNPAPGTVVAKNGNIAISTTSVPGVLLANNAPGQQDPRMAQTSTILLGDAQDIELAQGTEMVLGVAAGGGTQ